VSQSQLFVAIVWGVVLLFGLLALARRRRGGSQGRSGRRRWSGPGPGAAGAVYGMLNEDKRRAIEIIVEGRAEETDPEHADGTPTSGRPAGPVPGR